MIAVFAFSGCYAVKVDSISLQGMDQGQRKYLIGPAVEGVSLSDLTFIEFSRYIDAALSEHGYVKSANPAEADLGILVSYGTGTPRTEISVHDGGKLKTGLVSSTVYDRFLILAAYDLNAFRITKQEIQLWKTIITSSGSSDDLRTVIPYLVFAAKPYLGGNTGKRVKVILLNGDKRVKNFVEGSNQ
jgi:hypothetical protein